MESHSRQRLKRCRYLEIDFHGFRCIVVDGNSEYFLFAHLCAVLCGTLRLRNLFIELALRRNFSNGCFIAQDFLLLNTISNSIAEVA